MSDRIIPDSRVYRPAIPAAPAKPDARGASRTAVPQTSFGEILQGKLAGGATGLTFSQHAETRLRQRGITMKPEEMAKLNVAVDKAAAKGAKDSLVLFRDMAFIVNVKNRTVVTAVDGSSMKDNVFTQIDSAVIIS